MYWVTKQSLYQYNKNNYSTIMFKNSMDLRGKQEKVIIESGYSTDTDSLDYLEYNVNWAYLSTNFGMDAGTVSVLISGLLLVIFTGYLIIYNIFQISVIRDIRFYGLLKTIGTTGKQIRRIIRRQALILSAIGVPLGLIVGYFSGKAFVPLIMSNSTYAGSMVSVSPSPIIFVGAALFSVVTVFISTFKPGRIAAAVSPLEAVRYTDGNIKQTKKQRKLGNGGKMHRMALTNLGRFKRRTVLVFISLSLSLVLLNTVFTLSQSIDLDKFLAKFRPIGSMLWFFRYRFVLWPILVVQPFFFVIGAIIPLLSYILTDRQSIVEWLREAE